MISSVETHQSIPLVVATPKAVHDLPANIVNVTVDPEGMREFSERMDVEILPADRLVTVIRARRLSPLNWDITLDEASDRLICTKLSELPVTGERGFISLGMLRGRPGAQLVEPMMRRSGWGKTEADAEVALSRALAEHLLSGQIADSPGPQRAARETASGLGGLGGSLFKVRATGIERKIETAGGLRPYRVVRRAVGTVSLRAVT